MVDFVREGFLGRAPEFKRRFQNPIENGQQVDSKSKDVKLMKHRAHVWHKQLMGFVQLKTMSVLKDELPSKCVCLLWSISGAPGTTHCSYLSATCSVMTGSFVVTSSF